jgi:hypothetical protein
MTDQDRQSRVLIGVISSSSSSSSTTSSTPQQNQQVLDVARAILQACNSHEFPVHKTVVSEMLSKPNLTPEKKESILELSVVARLWNGLIQSKQKPTRFLGRKALLHAWSDLDVTSKLVQPKDDDDASKAIYAHQVAWIQEFEKHLYHPRDTRTEIDNDAALIWDTDGGASELARRRERRKMAATERGPVTPS